MGKEENRHDSILMVAVIVLALVCLCMYGIQGIFGFSLFPDEFGYWASAAGFLGYDFSEVCSISSYYSFGYSLILIPILKLFSDSIIAYRAAVIVNLLLQVTSFYILCRIAKKLFSDTDELLRIILAGMAVLYPPWVFYTQMTMTEGLLFFCYTVVVYFMILYIEKPSIIRGIITALASIYIYSVHMRAVGILAAVGITMLVVAFTGIKRSDNRVLATAFFAVIVLLIGFVICLRIKDIVIDKLYSSGIADQTYIGDYSGQTSKLKELSTLMGIGRFFASMIGKILYLGCATFGIAYIGIYSLIRRTIKKDLKAFFILMASFMQFMVMCIFLMHSADRGSNRFDLFLHGRYFEFVVPIMAMIGAYELLTRDNYIRKLVIAAGIIMASGIASIVIVSVNKVGMNDPHVMMMIGMSYFLNRDDFYPIRVIIMSIGFTLIIIGAIIIGIYFYKKKGNAINICIAYLLLVGLSYHACNHLIYICQSYIYGDIQVADEITNLRNNSHNGDIILLYEGGLEYIDTVQMRLRDEHIHLVYVDDSFDISDISKDSMVLVDFESGLKDKLSSIYEKYWESGHFDLYYNISER